MEILLLISAAVISCGVIYGYCRTSHPYITAVKSSLCGLSALFLINITSTATGCYIALNGVTVFIATMLSLPGVLALLLMKIIFNY